MLISFLYSVERTVYVTVQSYIHLLKFSDEYVKHNKKNKVSHDILNTVHVCPEMLMQNKYFQIIKTLETTDILTFLFKHLPFLNPRA